MKTIEEIMMGLLTKTLNMSEDEIKSLIYKEDSEDGELNDNALEALISKDADRISAIRDKYKNDKDDQYKRGQRETAEKFEKDIKKLFDFESELQGEDLLAEAKKQIAKEGGSSDELTDDKVKAHPLYIQLQNEKQREIDSLNQEWENKLNEKENEFTTRVTRSNATSKAIDLIRSKNPRLPEDASKAQKRLSVVGNELKNYNWKQDGDTLIPVDDKGHQLVDEHEKPITFDMIVENIGDLYFDFEDPEDKGEDKGKGGTGTGNSNGFNSRKHGRVKVPKTAEELETAMANAKTPEERSELSKAFIEAQKTE